MIDLSGATVLPGLIDAHTHMFNTRGAKTTTEGAMLIAVQNAQADLRAGFTAARDMSSHGNGYGDVEIRNAINEGRHRRAALSGVDAGHRLGNGRARLRTIRWQRRWCARRRRLARRCGSRLRTARIGSSCIRRAAIRSAPTGEDQYQVTYPLAVLQALIDETHRLGKKAGCHVYGGEGQKNAIVAGCDTIEHGFGLNQEQIDMMVAKGLYYDPTLVRYMEPYMDDVDAKNTGGKFRIIPIFEKAARMAAATKGIQVMMGSGADGSTFAHGTQGLEFEALVKRAGLTCGAGDPGGDHGEREGDGMAGADRVDRQGQVRRSDRGFGRSAGRHHGTAAGEVRDEGREDHPQRSALSAVTRSASYKRRRHRTGHFDRVRRWPTTAD